MSIKFHRGRRVISPAICCLALCLLGCSSNEPHNNEANPWRDQIQLDLPRMSEYQKQVFEDYRVSDGELRESHQLLEECVAQYGIDHQVVWPYSRMGSISEEYGQVRQDQLVDECEDEFTFYVEIYHREMLQNPLNEDFYDLVAACLVREGLVDPSLNGARLREAQNKDLFPLEITQSREYQLCSVNPKDLAEFREYAEHMVDPQWNYEEPLPSQ